MMGPVIRSALIIVILLVAVPLVIVIIASFSGGERLTFPPESLSVNPYRALIGNDSIRGALCWYDTSSRSASASACI